MYFIRQMVLPILLCAVSAAIALGWQSYSGFSNIRTLIIGGAIFCALMVLLNHIHLAIQSRLMKNRLAAIFGLENNLLNRIQKIETGQASALTVEDMQQRITVLEEQLKAQEASHNSKELASHVDVKDGNVVLLKPRQATDGKGRGKAASSRVYKPTLDNMLEEEAISIKLQPVIHLMSKEVMAVEAFAFLETKNGEQSVGEVIKSFDDAQRCQLDLIMVKRLSAIARKMELDGQLLPIHYSFTSMAVPNNKCWTKISNVLKGDIKLSSNLVPQISMARFRRLGDKETSRFLEFKEFGSQPCLTDCQGVNNIVQLASQHRISLLKLSVQELLSYTHKEGERVADILLPKLAKLGVETIANDVEKAHQAANLIDLDITLAQGPFISPARSLKTNSSNDAHKSSLDNIS